MHALIELKLQEVLGEEKLGQYRKARQQVAEQLLSRSGHAAYRALRSMEDVLCRVVERLCVVEKALDAKK